MNTHFSTDRSLSRRRVLATGLTAGAVAALGGPTAVAAGRRTPAPVLAIKHVTVIDATGAPPRPNCTVVVAGQRIVAVGGHRDVSVPRGAVIVDGSGKFLIPGLADMHVHSDAIEKIYAYWPGG